MTDNSASPHATGNNASMAGSLALPRYRTIVADPPWDYDRDTGRFPSNVGNENKHQPLPYPVMTSAAIAALPVREMADKDCRLFLWATTRGEAGRDGPAMNDCDYCDGTGLVTITVRNDWTGVPMDYDDQPCPECEGAAP